MSPHPADPAAYGYPGDPWAYGQAGQFSTGEPTLDQPYYGIALVPAVKRALRKYARFDGRASRSEYWWFFLAKYAVLVGLGVLNGIQQTLFGRPNPDGSTQVNALGAVLLVLLFLLFFGLVVPSLSLLVRRLHDSNLSAWLILLNLFPVMGTVVLHALALAASSPEGARFDRRPVTY